MKHYSSPILIFAFIILSFSATQAQEVKKVEQKNNTNINEVLIQKTALKNQFKQQELQQQLKASTTSQKKEDLKIDHNAAIELKINYLIQQACCEEEIEKLRNQLK